MVVGQNGQKVDSLKQVLISAKHDSVRVFTLLGLAKEYKIPNPDSAKFYSMEAMRIAKEVEFIKGIAAAYYSLGDIEVSLDASEQARLY